MKCKICAHSDGHTAYTIREMMFGYRDVFTYFQCAHCKCLQIESIPQNIAYYYPQDFYAFTGVAATHNPLKKRLMTYRDNFAVFNKGIVGKILYSFYPHPHLHTVSLCGLSKDSSILDVGCGAGGILYALQEIGFKHLLGIDPFIQKDITYANGLTIRKQHIHEVKGQWDRIMFHHSFEHMAEQVDVLTSVKSLLPTDGICCISMPVVSSFAWEKYKTDWVQIDAPRHFFIHSIASMELVASQAGFTIDDVIYNSYALQFWGSEQYAKDIPLTDACSYAINPKKSIFSKKDIARYTKKSHELNRINQGDQAVFLLKKKVS